MESITTPRLVLYPLGAAEAERLVTGVPDEGDRWGPGYPGEGDAEAARHFLAEWARAGDPRPFGLYEVRRRADGRAIGGVGFHRPPDAEGAVTIGYGLAPEARGQGYAAEALRAVLRFARSRGVRRVRGDADLANVASQHVMRAAGMRAAGADERVRCFVIDLLADAVAPDAPPHAPPAAADAEPPFSPA